jgi:PAS domain S-box-containing protein
MANSPTAPDKPESAQRSAPPRLLAMQVAEVYRFGPMAAAFSFFGVLLAFGVLVEIGDQRRGALWFFYATAVTFYRAFIYLAYRRRPAESRPQKWARLLIAGNLLAGIQWGLLGTILFPNGPSYAELFTLMVIICFIAGSVTAYSGLRGAHEALSIPATIPTAVYVFFLREDPHWYAGIAALFFCFATIYYATKLHRHLETTFRLQIERDDLTALTGLLNQKLEQEKLELVHRAAVRGVSAETARDEASRLHALFERSPLPQLECDANGNILSSNSAAQRLFGLTREQLAGASLGSLVTSVARHGARFSDVSSSEIVEVDVSTNGGVIACTASVTPLPAAEGRRAGFGVVLTGIPVSVA